MMDPPPRFKRSGAERVVLEYKQTSGGDFVLTVNISKIKHIMTRRQVKERDREPIALGGGT